MSMELLIRNPLDLVANPWNSNRVARPAFEKLKQSLTTYGSFKPIVARELPDGTLEILGGYHRNEAAKELGWKEVPVINLGPVAEDKAKEISLIDNTRYGEDDKELLDKLLSEMDDLSTLEAAIPIEELLPSLDEDALLEELTKDTAETSEKDETHKTIKLKFEIDKAEEIEAILSKVAEDHDYKYSDGYANWADALYHILILDR